MGNCACFQGLPARSAVRESVQQRTETHEGGSIVKDASLHGVSMRQPGPGQASEVKPIEEKQNLEAEWAERVQTKDAKSATMVSTDESEPAEEDHDDESKPEEEVKLGVEESVRSYMWMWGDCNPVAKFNPARWSENQSAESMIHELRWQPSKDMHRPVKIKDQRGGSWYFETAEQAISAMTHATKTGGQPCSAGQPTEDETKPAENNADVEAKPTESEESLETRSQQEEEAELAEQLPTGEDNCAVETSKVAASYMWMWGDCNPLATHDPMRWSQYQSAESMIHDLRSQQSNDMHRPVKIKDQTGGDWCFKTAEQALLAMTDAMETGGQPCTPGQPKEDNANPTKTDEEEAMPAEVDEALETRSEHTEKAELAEQLPAGKDNPVAETSEAVTVAEVQYASSEQCALHGAFRCMVAVHFFFLLTVLVLAGVLLFVSLTTLYKYAHLDTVEEVVRPVENMTYEITLDEPTVEEVVHPWTLLKRWTNEITLDESSGEVPWQVKALVAALIPLSLIGLSGLSRS